jgi:predicted MFS family arabinose efflux permease
VTLGSIPGGNVVNRVGTRAAVIVAGIVSVVSMLGIWALATTPAVLVLCLIGGGLGHSLCAPATDVAVSQGIGHSRQGVAYGFKQAAIPLAALLSGLAVPALAVPFGWRSVFAVAAVLGSVVIVLVLKAPLVGRAEPGQPRTGDLPLRWTSTRVLALIGLGAGLGTAAGTAVSIFLVDAGQNAGLSASRAGLLLTVGGAAGIGGRLVAGFVIDRVQGDGIRATFLMLVVGGLGYMLLATGHVALFDVAALIAFGAGWGWGGLLRYGVVRVHSVAPGAAMGIINAALALGALVGPLALGLIVDASSFTVGWLVAASFCIVGGLSVFAGSRWAPSGRHLTGVVPAGMEAGSV